MTETATRESDTKPSTARYQSIHVMHPDEKFAQFLEIFLSIKGFDVTVSNSNVNALVVCSRNPPDLIVLNRESPLLDLVGFFIRKEHAKQIAETPLFLIGEFNPKEIADYKAKNVRAFLSQKINPPALIERLCLFFAIPLPRPDRRVPLLMDVHAKDSILIVQLEGGLESDKLVVLNYLMRGFFTKENIRTPRVMLIVPHLDAESISSENVRLLFAFTEFPELKVNREKITILTRCTPLISQLSHEPDLRSLSVVDNYLVAFRSLLADFNMETIIPLEFVKPGSQFFLDLYTVTGQIRVRAMTEVTEQDLADMKAAGITKLKYYGDMPSSDIAFSGFDPSEMSVMDYITREFTPLSLDLFNTDVSYEKQNLFFEQIRDQKILFISLDSSALQAPQQALSTYFGIDNMSASEDLKARLDEDRYSVIFVDLSLASETVLKIMHTIRSNATRRKTTVILLAKTISKEELVILRSYGTDHIILQPFTNEKFYRTIYKAVTLDRGT